MVCYENLIKRRDLKFSLMDKSLDTKTAMLMFEHIVGRYKYLGIEKKDRKPQITIIYKEGKNLWIRVLNFPMLSDRSIELKIQNVLKLYDECIKRGK